MKSMKGFCLILCILVLVSSASIKLSMAKPWSGSTIYIKSDGSIEPSDAPIVTSDKVTYRVTEDIQSNITSGSEAIVIERNNIILDGQNHKLLGPTEGRGIKLENRVNVAIKSIKVESFRVGIYLGYSNNITIAGSIVENNWRGIHLYYSNNTTITGNTFVNNGLFLDASYSNTILDNTVNDKPLVYLEDASGLTVGDAGQVILVNCRGIKVENLELSNTPVGVELWGTSESIITGNIAENNYYGIYLGYSNNNTITGNIVENNDIGIRPRFSNGNTIHRNDFTGNQIQVSSMESANFWDDGSKGNYWSDYLGSDADGDGVGDTPYVIDDNNKDNRPSMQAYFKAFFEVSDLNINPSSVRLGETVTISITVKNTGGKTGLHSVTLKVDNHVVDTKSITLKSGQSATVGFTYTPTSEGTYSIDVNGLTGSLTVSKEEVQAPAEIPWLIIIGVLVVLVAAVLVLLLWRRKRVPPPPPPPT